jgi:hypothetical protein
MPRLGPLAALAAILLTASVAHGESREATERAARKACLSGDVTKGVELLSDLFLDTRDATHIFNQGRCFEQNNRCEEALGRFREYLRKATALSAEVRTETEKHIADCQAVLAQQAALVPADQGAQPGARTDTVPVPSAALHAAPVQQPDVSGSAAPAVHPGRGLRIGGIACGLVGLAAVGTGVYFYTQASYYSDKVAKQAVRNPSDEDAGVRAETMQWVFYGIGGAALATGTVLYLLGRNQAAKGDGRVAVAPLLGPGLAGLSAQGAF